MTEVTAFPCSFWQIPTHCGMVQSFPFRPTSSRQAVPEFFEITEVWVNGHLIYLYYIQSSFCKRKSTNKNCILPMFAQKRRNAIRKKKTQDFIIFDAIIRNSNYSLGYTLEHINICLYRGMWKLVVNQFRWKNWLIFEFFFISSK